MVGCGEDADPGDAEFNDATGVAETGFTPYDVGSGLIDPTECLSNEHTGASGDYFDTDDFSDQKHFGLNCIQDAREQACISMGNALDAKAKSLGAGAHKTAVKDLRDYLNGHITECYEGLGDDFPTPLFFWSHMDSVEAVGYLEGDYYGLAARFVAFIIETHGIEALRQLCSTKVRSASELDAALLMALGSTLEDTELALSSYPPWTVGQLRQDQACEDLEVLGPGEVSWTPEFDCSSEGVEGRVGGPLWTHRLVDLADGGAFEFEFDSNQELRLQLELRSCERDGLASNYYEAQPFLDPKPGAPVTLLLYDLPPGVYVVRLLLDEVPDSTTPLTVGVNVAGWP